MTSTDKDKDDINYKSRKNLGIFLMVVGFIILVFPIMASGAMIFRILIGLVAAFIILIGYYIYLRNESYLLSTVRAVWPPLLYFQKIGSYCPDYWTLDKIDSENKKVTCRNTFGVQVRDSTNKNKCYDTEGTGANANYLNTKTFTLPNFQNIYKSVDDFEEENKEYRQDACDFVENCGPNDDNPRATWLGIGTQNGYFKC